MQSSVQTCVHIFKPPVLSLLCRYGLFQSWREEGETHCFFSIYPFCYEVKKWVTWGASCWQTPDFLTLSVVSFFPGRLQFLPQISDLLDWQRNNSSITLPSRGIKKWNNKNPLTQVKILLVHFLKLSLTSLQLWIWQTQPQLQIWKKMWDKVI